MSNVQQAFKFSPQQIILFQITPHVIAGTFFKLFWTVNCVYLWVDHVESTLKNLLYRISSILSLSMLATVQILRCLLLATAGCLQSNVQCVYDTVPCWQAIFDVYVECNLLRARTRCRKFLNERSNEMSAVESSSSESRGIMHMKKMQIKVKFSDLSVCCFEGTIFNVPLFLEDIKNYFISMFKCSIKIQFIIQSYSII